MFTRADVPFLHSRLSEFRRMPRGQPATKRQQGAANQRDTRHENGLVGPGKRVQRQKSNGHLNGYAKQQENSHPPTPPLPATPPHTNGHARQSNAADFAADNKVPADSLRRGSFSGYSESSSSEYSHNMSTLSVSQENHRRIDVNAAKNPAVHRDSGPLSYALTVLRSCPLYDTIAILIVLLQLPPTFLSLVHLLFATLTFVPPSASATSGLSFVDIFEGTLGTPSMATIVVVDLFVLLIWLFLWGSLQDIALDLAQTVIALTLGGGTSGKDTGLNNVLVCFGIVGLSHLARSGNIKQSGIRALLSSSGGIMGSPDPDDPLERAAQTRNKKGAHGWIRSILAIHILAQGLVRYVRDWYVRREKQVNSVSMGDPEAGKALADANNDSLTPNTQSLDNDSSTSLPVSSTLINSKKKRKQSAQVRIRQPLWAALASTKIVMVKEYETSHTAAESAGTNATDINNLGNAPFNTEADRIWITYVGSDEVSFSTSYFPTHTPLENCEEKKLDASGVDKSKPFFVRVNQTVWHLTRIRITTDPDEPEGQGTRWNGEISGLAAASSYECDFVSTANGAIIFSTSIRTLQVPTTDTAGLSPNPQVSSRPGSPITTLKISIASSEIKLAEERNRQKRERKDQRTKLSSVRKELDRLLANLATGGGNDDRLKQKIQQSNLHMKQAEDALISLEEDIQSLEAIPTDDTAHYTSAKSAFQSQREAHKKYRAEIQEAKQCADRDVLALKNELSSIQQKRERYQSRITKLNAEHDRILEANAKGLDEVQRKDKARFDNETNRSNMEMMYMERLAELEHQITIVSDALHGLVLGIDIMTQNEIYASASPNASVQNLNAAASPFTADPNALPDNAAYGWNAAGPSHSGGYAAGAFNNSTGPAQGIRTRGRSSSMLSNVSGFTQSSEEGGAPGPSFAPPQQMGTAIWGDDNEKGSFGSGSASRSGSGSGSAGDPKSPIGNGKAALARW
ncbi:putative ubiquitination network signaling protein [Lachnellula subtilissima]|uniref:Putative ubiquitination network signaling protein n=1 Tax=Lachnellula subtilissima TaxID=602034 RepID=A0A8H8RTW3_9HELO|nr:putative ubiquitination network signaling protein [Lachnellula subtilissima]